jgi:hypothetical protein
MPIFMVGRNIAFYRLVKHLLGIDLKGKGDLIWQVK